ncbi:MULTISPECIES: hypothetical protein [Mumia]|uniref:hypothetical protein n=1 Tax=Mumia TaxID=1546255 RepID=UPI00141FA87C|nr:MULTISPECIES: hypothetical protein [unclassified Mumia]QMW67249.1 hypothetical protein H4N58_04845 [Mumia sp. ZJ1417]
MSDPQQPPGGQPPGNEPPSGPPPYEPPPQGPPPQGPPSGAGGYGPPPQGPPPGGGGYGPPGGYGAPPPQGPPSYSGGPGGPGPQHLSVGSAISYGWDKFRANWGVWVLVTLVFFVIQALLSGISNGFDYSSSDAWDDSGYTLATGLTVLGVIAAIASTIVQWLMQAAQTRGGLQETTGNKPSFGDFFKWGDRAGAVILTLLMLAALTFVGIILCILPGIIFTFFAWYTLWFVLDQGLNPLDALQASFRLVGNNLGPVFLLALALIGINIVGACLCGIGLLVTIPVTLIATAYSFKFLTQQPIA